MMEAYAARRAVEAATREALMAELADEHDCYHEMAGLMLACGACAERATRMAARLSHEGLLR